MGRRLVVEADGGSRGNPGPAGYGALVRDAGTGELLAEVAEPIGEATNNVAEYRGLIAGLEAVADIDPAASVEVRMDSKLVVEQMSGRWKIKHPALQPLALRAREVAASLGAVSYRWVPRSQNAHADRLANEAMDAAARGETWQARTRAETPPSAPGDDAAAARPGASAGQAGGGGRAAGSAEGPSGAAVTRPSASAGGAAGRGDGGRTTGGGRGSGPSEATRGGAVTREAAARGADADAGLGTRPQAGTGWMARPTRAATSLLLLRHGETPLSIEKRFSGTGDPVLTAKGLAQAEAAAARLSREPYRIDVIASSPLKRALQTAEAVAARTGLDVVVEEGLRETDFGAWEGHTFAEIQRRWPDHLSAWLADTSVAPPGGESFDQTSVRVEAALARLIAAHPGRTVLVVSHVTPIKTILRLALTAPPAALYRMHLDIACLSAVDYYADGPAVVRSVNDTAHLR